MPHPSPTDIPVYLGQLADPLKLRIITTLKEKPMPVQELIEELIGQLSGEGKKIRQPAVSKALKGLEKYQLVICEPSWRTRKYNVNQPLLDEVADTVEAVLHSKREEQE